MATISLRQTLAPTGNWIIVGIHDDQHGENINGIMTPAGSWTEVLIYNPNAAAVSVAIEVRDADGVVQPGQPSCIIQPGATARPAWNGKFDHGTMILRCPQPIVPFASRGTGANQFPLTVHPQPAG